MPLSVVSEAAIKKRGGNSSSFIYFRRLLPRRSVVIRACSANSLLFLGGFGQGLRRPFFYVSRPRFFVKPSMKKDELEMLVKGGIIPHFNLGLCHLSLVKNPKIIATLLTLLPAHHTFQSPDPIGILAHVNDQISAHSLRDLCPQPAGYPAAYAVSRCSTGLRLPVSFSRNSKSF